MWRHISPQAKGKHKQCESSSSSSQAWLDTSASLFAVIESFYFIFIYTCSFEFIVMFLFAGHNDKSSFLGCCMTRNITTLEEHMARETEPQAPEEEASVEQVAPEEHEAREEAPEEHEGSSSEGGDVEGAH
jgi:hypothetical protein